MHDQFSYIKGGKRPERKGEGFYPSGTKKITGIREEDRETFNRVFQEYIQGVARGSDWQGGQDRMKQGHERAKRETD